MPPSSLARVWRAGLVAAALLAAPAAALAEAAPSPAPDPQHFLFWTPAQQRYGYRHIETVFNTHVVRRGPRVHPLPVAAHPLTVRYAVGGETWDTARFMAHNDVAGLLVIKDGRIVLERYALGETAADRWTSFSVGKSVTSTLVGAAIKDGYIKSLNDPVTAYLPGLKGGAYEGVSIRDLLTMKSGVRWNEDYADPKSDVNQLGLQPAPAGQDSPIVAYMAKLPREAAPGTKWEYKTGESDLVGVLVAAAVHRPLAQYLSEKIWSTYGMEQDAVWMLDSHGQEFGGCCISMTLRDYGRFAQFFMNGGVAGGRAVLPAGWTRAATTSAADTGWDGFGYGFQWWVRPDEGFEAIGIFGQAIYINPRLKLVIVTSSAWPQADMDDRYAAFDAYVAAVVKAAGGR